MPDEDPLAQHRKELGLGATGQFPHGKLRENDEGEIRTAIAGDPVKRMVFIDYGKPVAWLAMPPEDAENLASALIKAAAKARGDTAPVTVIHINK